MLFERLDSSGDRMPVYTIGWRIEDNPDEWTRRFLGFKQDEQPHFFGGAYVFREAVKELIAVRALVASKTVLSAALSSKNETADPNSPLCRTGKWVAQSLSIRWSPDIFTKSIHKSLHSISGGGERDAEVRGKYRCEKISNAETVIILDDFVTRGATLGDMERAASLENPMVKVVGLALAKNERERYASQFDQIVDNTHVPVVWDRLWCEEARKERK